MQMIHLLTVESSSVLAENLERLHIDQDHMQIVSEQISVLVYGKNIPVHLKYISKSVIVLGIQAAKFIDTLVPFTLENLHLPQAVALLQRLMRVCWPCIPEWTSRILVAIAIQYKTLNAKGETDALEQLVKTVKLLPDCKNDMNLLLKIDPMYRNFL